MRNCTICGLPIHLVPSAAERAAKDVTGRTAAYYASLFSEHSDCTLRSRERKLAEKSTADMPVTFRHLEMLRLRQRVLVTFGMAISRVEVDYGNNLSEPELRRLL